MRFGGVLPRRRNTLKLQTSTAFRTIRKGEYAAGNGPGIERTDEPAARRRMIRGEKGDPYSLEVPHRWRLLLFWSFPLSRCKFVSGALATLTSLAGAFFGLTFSSARTPSVAFTPSLSPSARTHLQIDTSGADPPYRLLTSPLLPPPANSVAFLPLSSPTNLLLATAVSHAALWSPAIFGGSRETRKPW